jgi:hypothetical protein
MLFSWIYFNMIKTCFNNVQSSPTSCKRKLTRGIFPLTVIFYIIMIFIPTFWLNRVLAICCFFYCFVIFFSNDYIVDETFDVSKIQINDNGTVMYSKTVSDKQKKIFADYLKIHFHLNHFDKEYQMKFDDFSNNSEFLRNHYCKYTGKYFPNF